MTTDSQKYSTDAFEAIHSSAHALFRVGAIDKATLRNFDLCCLPVPQRLGPQQIRQIREHNRVSQPVFAHFLNTTESTVQQWERGAKRPGGMALKLLSVVQKHGLEILA